MIIGLANSKGGVGKSTLARNFAVYLNDQGRPTALVDAEEGAPTATLLETFEPNIETRAASKLEDMYDAVQELTEAGYHVILDAPGKEGDQVSALCLLSDLVIIPLCVSEQDLLQTVGILNLVRLQQRRSREQKPDAMIVFTRTLKDDIATPDVRKFLGKFNIPMAQTEIRERVAVKRSVSVMRAEHFYKNNGPANDFVNLIEEAVMPHLENEKRIANE